MTRNKKNLEVRSKHSGWFVFNKSTSKPVSTTYNKKQDAESHRKWLVSR